MLSAKSAEGKIGGKIRIMEGKQRKAQRDSSTSQETEKEQREENQWEKSNRKTEERRNERELRTIAEQGGKRLCTTAQKNMRKYIVNSKKNGVSSKLEQ